MVPRGLHGSRSKAGLPNHNDCGVRWIPFKRTPWRSEKIFLYALFISWQHHSAPPLAPLSSLFSFFLRAFRMGKTVPVLHRIPRLQAGVVPLDCDPDGIAGRALDRCPISSSLSSSSHPSRGIVTRIRSRPGRSRARSLCDRSHRPDNSVVRSEGGPVFDDLSTSELFHLLLAEPRADVVCTNSEP